MDLKEIKTKRPWKRVMPEGYMGCISQDVASIPDDPMKYMIVTQSDFLREYYPSGHAINDPKKYPDIYREELVPKIGYNGEETGEMTRRYYIERVPRCSFPFQMVITLKQLVHLCGNDVQFDLMGEKGSKDEKAYEQFKEGWQMKKMGNALYELAKSVKITGDGAIAGYFDNGQFGWTSLSYKNGDTLYPHFDPITGKLNAFARSYSSFDEDGKEMTEWLEVWDETNLYRFKKNGEDYKTIKDRIYEIFNLSGYTLVYRKPHGFPFIPVVYKRDDDGPCWAFSQDSCDNYEMSFSQMKHNNQAYGEPILMFIGNEDSVDLQHDMNGTIKTISAESGADAKYLQAQSASESYMKQLEQEYKMIYEGSFAVIPPEVKSGDLPAAALKILYSPAVEKP